MNSSARITIAKKAIYNTKFKRTGSRCEAERGRRTKLWITRKKLTALDDLCRDHLQSNRRIRGRDAYALNTTFE